MVRSVVPGTLSSEGSVGPSVGRSSYTDVKNVTHGVNAIHHGVHIIRRCVLDRARCVRREVQVT